MWRTLWAAGALLAVVCALSGMQGAWAQSVPNGGDTPRAQHGTPRPLEIDFEVLELKGQLVGPDGKLIQVDRRPVFNPLIQLRSDWNQEMKTSIDDVK